ncbi:AfsR/SARP family transcriptional regulator [Streptomyces sp. M10(2022)]
MYVFERLARRGPPNWRPAPRSRRHPAHRAGPVARPRPRRPARAGSRVRAEARRLTATQQRIEADLRHGATEGLVPELRELTAAHPYDEPLRAQLLRSLRAEGRQADALVAYEEARKALADGLGTDPGRELTALHRELLEAPEPAPADGRGPQGNIRPGSPRSSAASPNSWPSAPI